MKKTLSIILCAVMTLSSMVVGSVSVSAAVSKPKLTSVKATSSSSVTIKWNKVKKVKGYVIYRKTKGKSFSKIATVSASKTSYTNKKLNPSTKYTYALKAYKTSGSKKVYSAFSNSKSATTKAGYSFNKKSVTLKNYGETTTVTIKGLSKNKYYNVQWSSSDTNIAYVSGYRVGKGTIGTITAYKSGTCTVKAKYNGKTYSCKVYVKMPASYCTLTKPSLPKECSYIYNTYNKGPEVQTTMKITKLTHEFVDRTDGTVALRASVTGEKTFDKDGAIGTNYCNAVYKVVNSSGIVVYNSTFGVSSMKVGEKFMKENIIYVTNLPADDYTLVLEDRVS